MTYHSILSHLPVPYLTTVRRLWQFRLWQQYPTPRLCCSDGQLPDFVRSCSVTMTIRSWLPLVPWSALPPQQATGPSIVPWATYIAAFLVKTDQQLPTIAALRRFLVAHPALVWGLGFPLQLADNPLGFDIDASLPSRQHFGRVLRHLSNDLLQALLSAQVAQMQTLLPDSFGQTVSLDTKAILAWVKENNPKEYIKEGRFDKSHQPVGDPDCKLGCKRRHRRLPAPLAITPVAEGKPATGLPASIGEFYWGYASGIVVTKVDNWGEFVLAEFTQTFDKGETTYFFPLMAQVEQRLGFRPLYGALDAGFDAFYIYDYFHSPDHNGFAAIPFSEKGGYARREFNEDGLPLCAAGLAMPLKFAYTDRTTAIIPYQRAKHVCPLLFPQPDGQTCPIEHKNWPKGGCSTSIANTIGARLRHTLDRQSDRYRLVYDQRTATERIFSQAVALGMERPKLRNQAAITNQNTLIYLLINLRAIQRVLNKLNNKHK
jgi:hypothetical protein